MKCSKCGKEIADESLFCANCGTKLIQKNKSKNNILKYVLILFFIVVISIIIIFFNRNTKKVETISANVQTNNMSFEYMKSNKNNYSEKEKKILDYFDNDYFYLYENFEELQRYPSVFEDAKINFTILVKEIIKSDENEYIAVGVISDLTYGNPDAEILSLDEIEPSKLITIKGKQLSKRVIVGDYRDIYGYYKGTETYEVNGKKYILPTVETLKVIEDYAFKYDIDTITTVAKEIFGNDIKISTPEIEESYEDPYAIAYGIYGTDNVSENFYVITLDNQSNSNFKYFNIHTNRTNISYDPKYNNIANSTIKKLFISADFEHFMVTTYDNGLKHVYIEYYDKEYNKIWTREFSYNSDIINNSPMDYTNEKMAVVIDNDLYFINLKNGENIIEPIIVSSKIEKVYMMSDGILLTGTDSKDTIMKVDYNGKILYRKNIELSNYNIYGMNMQIVNNKMVISYCLGSHTVPTFYKYIVLNSDGTIELES